VLHLLNYAVRLLLLIIVSLRLRKKAG